MDELDILKEEMVNLKHMLDREQIVNDRLLRTVMKQKTSWLNTFVKSEIIILPIAYLIFVAACVLFDISQWFAFSFLILGLADVVADFRTFRIPAKIFSTCSMMEVRKKLEKQKKERSIHMCIAVPLALTWLVVFAMQIFEEGTPESYAAISGGVIGGIIGAITVIIIYRKAQKTSDTVIEDTFNSDE